MQEYFNEGKIKIDYEPEKEGYWVSIGNNNHFIDSRAFENFENVQGLNLLDRLNAYNDMIQHSLIREKIFPSVLETAFSKVKAKRLEEFEEFKKSENL